MSIQATHDRVLTPAAPARAVIHPVWVRVTHWINVVAMVVMIGSGWEIYNASPLFPFRFPRAITLGGWLAGALLWHFAAMWLLMVNGLIYLTVGLATGRFRKKLLPITPEGVISAAALKCVGGGIQGRLWPRTPEERETLVAAGFDLDRVLTTDDLVAGDDGDRARHFLGRDRLAVGGDHDAGHRRLGFGLPGCAERQEQGGNDKQESTERRHQTVLQNSHAQGASPLG